MENRNLLVLIDPESETYNQYVCFLKPYLDFFGFPYNEVSVKEKISDCALILIGQQDLKLPDHMAYRIRHAVEQGTGLISFDANVLLHEAFRGFIKSAENNTARADRIIIQKGHYITELHNDAEEILLYSQITIPAVCDLKDGETLIRYGLGKFLEVSTVEAGKIVLWNSAAWMSHKVLGPLCGLDDVLWRSIVWAAKKPFVMQGMPPLIGMRIDDVWGTWREIYPENPLKWVEIAQKYGYKPWLGIFQDNINETATEKVREYTREGTASAFPHAFAGCEWVPSDISEHWIYYDHSNARPYSDEVMRENAMRAREWFEENGIPISKLALGHYYEMGANAIPYLLEWGCEFIGIHMNPDVAYLSKGEWIKAGPYRTVESGMLSGCRPVYYEDYILEGKLFNCVTEIRDVCGYEWAPNSDPERNIRNGVAQVRRAFDSMVPAAIFTHESKYIQRMSAEVFEKSLSGIAEAILNYEPIYCSMDEICAYARAKHDLCIRDVKLENKNKLRLQLVGKNDMNTKCYVFTANSAGTIEQKLVDLPQISSEQEVEIAL